MNCFMTLEPTLRRVKDFGTSNFLYFLFIYFCFQFIQQQFPVPSTPLIPHSPTIDPLLLPCFPSEKSILPKYPLNAT